MNTFCHKLAASIRNLIHTVYGRRRRDQVLSTPDISEKVLSGAYTPCPHMDRQRTKEGSPVCRRTAHD